ncbi:hypothetical protein Tco_0138144 [Tanacetum coccineum]
MIHPEPKGSTQGYPLDSVEVLRFEYLAGNPVKIILLKLNLPDDPHGFKGYLKIEVKLRWPPKVTLGRLLPHARGLGFKPRRGGFPSGAKKEWGLSPKAKKRARRVSFVENTTVFNRDDEDSATPVNHKQQQSPSDEPMFWNDRDNGNDEDEDMEDDEDDDEMDESGGGGSRSLFL